MPVTSLPPEQRTVVPLLLLTFVTGLIDAISVLVLGHVFVANMTGNAIFLGFLFVPGAGIDLTGAALAVGGFVAGAIIGGRLVRMLGGDARRWITVALGTEVAMLLVLAALQAMGILRFHDGTKLILIAGLAVAFGIQNSTARQFGVADLHTTVLTSTIVGIGVDSRLAGGTGDRGKLRFAVVATMILGAVVGATLSRHFVTLVLVLAAVLVAVSALLLRRS